MTHRPEYSMIEQLLRLSLHEELRRAKTNDDAKRTIQGNQVPHLLEAGMVTEETIGTANGAPRWVRLSDRGRRFLDRELRLKRNDHLEGRKAVEERKNGSMNGDITVVPWMKELDGSHVAEMSHRDTILKLYVIPTNNNDFEYWVYYLKPGVRDPKGRLVPVKYEPFVPTFTQAKTEAGEWARKFLIRFYESPQVR